MLEISLWCRRQPALFSLTSESRGGARPTIITSFPPSPPPTPPASSLPNPSLPSRNTAAPFPYPPPPQYPGASTAPNYPAAQNTTGKRLPEADAPRAAPNSRCPPNPHSSARADHRQLAAARSLPPPDPPPT